MALRVRLAVGLAVGLAAIVEVATAVVSAVDVVVDLEEDRAVEALARSYLWLFEATKEVGCSYVYGWMRRETVHVMLDLTLVYTVTTSCVIGSRVGGIRDSRILDCNFPPDFVSMRIRREGSRSSITNMCKSHSL